MRRRVKTTSAKMLGIYCNERRAAYYECEVDVALATCGSNERACHSLGTIIVMPTTIIETTTSQRTVRSERKEATIWLKFSIGRPKPKRSQKQKTKPTKKKKSKLKTTKNNSPTCVWGEGGHSSRRQMAARAGTRLAGRRLGAYATKSQRHGCVHCAHCEIQMENASKNQQIDK